eukprot:TRINITY_DN759_c0_g1_i1.p1 TRINITY_DN759_c0_g1~~TRINITY_DN759_c0_g1_i1.p1  ORF type:complete len:924 (+),score=320.38 TRINITY_DN759_c0_g1_i1:520-3291(+)
MKVYAVNGRVVKNLGEVKDAFMGAGTKVAVTVIEAKREAGERPPVDIKCLWVSGIPPDMTFEDGKALLAKHGPIVGVWKKEKVYIVEYTTKHASMQAMLEIDEIGILPGQSDPVTCEYKLVPESEFPVKPEEEAEAPQKAGDPSLPTDESYWEHRGSMNPVRAAGLYRSMKKDIRGRVFSRGIVPKSTQNIEKTKKLTMYPLPVTWVGEVVEDFVELSSRACGLTVPTLKKVTVYRGKGLIDGCEYNIAEIETNLPVEAAQIVGCTNGFDALPKESDHDDMDIEMDDMESMGALHVTLGFDTSLEKGDEMLTIDVGDDAKYRLAPEHKLPCRFHCVFGKCFVEACPRSHQFPAGDPATFHKKAIRIDNLPPKLTMEGIATMVRSCVGEENVKDVLWVDHFRLKSTNSVLSNYSCVLQIWKSAKLKAIMELLQKKSLKDQKGSPLRITQFTSLTPIIGRPVEPGDPEKPYEAVISRRQAQQAVRKRKAEPPVPVAQPPVAQPISLPPSTAVVDEKTRQMAMQLEALKETNKKLWEANVTLMSQHHQQHIQQHQQLQQQQLQQQQLQQHQLQQQQLHQQQLQQQQLQQAMMPPPRKKHKNLTYTPSQELNREPPIAQPVTMAAERCTLCGLRGHEGNDCPKAAQFDTLEIRNIRKELEEARGKRAGYMKALVSNPTSKKTQMKIVGNNTRISYLEKLLTEKIAVVRTENIPVAEPVKRPGEEKPPQAPPAAQAAQSLPLQPAVPMRRPSKLSRSEMERLRKCTTVALKQLAKDRNVDLEGCVERTDMLNILAAAGVAPSMGPPLRPGKAPLPMARPADPPKAAKVADAVPVKKPEPAPVVDDDDDEDYMPTAVNLPKADPIAPPPATAVRRPTGQATAYKPEAFSTHNDDDTEAYVPSTQSAGASAAPPPYGQAPSATLPTRRRR